MSNKVNIVACGGFGENVLLLLSQREVFAQLKDNLNLFALDTSGSNLKRFAGTPLDALVKKILVPKADGSGKHRAENYEQIAALVTETVNGGWDDGLTILISSCSGGSGAVIAGEAHEILSKRGKPILSMLLGTDEDGQALGNTIKTIKTYQHKAAQGTRNFAVFYGENRFEDPADSGKTIVDENRADEVFVTNLEDLIMVGHEGNEDLDSKDIYNWLNFPIAQKEPGAIRFVSLVSRKEDEDFATDGEVPMSALSLLAKRGIVPQYVEGTGYSTRGFVAADLAFSGGIVEVQYQLFSGKSAKLANLLGQKQKTFAAIQAKQEEAAAGDQIKKHVDDNVSEGGTFL